jgi:beta-lactamase regulating signal transducer with metallopeptidase domain
MNLPSTSQLALWFLLSCTAKTTLLLGLAASAAYLLRHHSATRRHYVWALGMASSMALPLLMLLLPSWHSATLGNVARFLGTGHTAAKNTTFQGLPSMVIDAVAASWLSGQMFRLILLLWGLGTLFVVVSLLGGLARLAWISAQSTPVAGEDWGQTVVRICGQLRIARRVRVLECADAASMPLTWGMVRPHILLPAGATRSCYPMNSRTSRVTTGWCRFVPNCLAASIGSIRLPGSQPRVCEGRVNALAMIPS